jgi:PEP-CTERM motif
MKQILTGVLFLGIAGFSPCFATTVTAGGGQIAANSITFSGTTLATLSGPVIFPPGSPNPLSATYTETVLRDSTTGFLDFVFTVTDTTVGANATYPGILETVTMASYTGFTTDVGYVAGTGNSATPISMGRTADVVNFDWRGFGTTTANPIMPGQTTPELVIKTNAPTYTLGTLGANDGIAGGATVYGPSSGVPEPLSMALLGGGLAAIGVVRLRRKMAR